jgi:hypothetical protein
MRIDVYGIRVSLSTRASVTSHLQTYELTSLRAYAIFDISNYLTDLMHHMIANTIAG